MDEATVHLLIVEVDSALAAAIAHWATRRGHTAELATDLEGSRKALAEATFVTTSQTSIPSAPDAARARYSSSSELSLIATQLYQKVSKPLRRSASPRPSVRL